MKCDLEKKISVIETGDPPLDDDNIDGEKVIPSYHLKQMFLYEVENIPIDKRNDKDLTELIPYKVYKRLLNCYEAEMIPSFFFRKQNMYKVYDISLSLQKRLCQNIVTMLEKIGFDEHQYNYLDEHMNQ